MKRPGSMNSAPIHPRPINRDRRTGETGAVPVRPPTARLPPPISRLTYRRGRDDARKQLWPPPGRPEISGDWRRWCCFAVEPARSAAKYGARANRSIACRSLRSGATRCWRPVELGLGTCWVDAVNENLAGQAIRLRPGQPLRSSLPLGYPDRKPPPTSRAARCRSGDRL